MRRITFVMLIILSVHLICFAQNLSSSATSLVMHRERVGNQDARGWSEAKSSKGGFAVSLPGLFNDFSVNALNPKGVNVATHIVATLKEAPVKYLASCIEPAPGVTLSSASLDEMVEKMRQVRTVTNVLSVNYQGNPGVEFRVSNETGHGILRVYVIGNKLYQLVVDYGSGTGDESGQDCETFFTSFKVLE